MKPNFFHVATQKKDEPTLLFIGSEKNSFFQNQNVGCILDGGKEERVILFSENSPNLTCDIKLRVHNINGQSTVPPLHSSMVEELQPQIKQHSSFTIVFLAEILARQES